MCENALYNRLANKAVNMVVYILIEGKKKDLPHSQNSELLPSFKIRQSSTYNHSYKLGIEFPLLSKTVLK